MPIYESFETSKNKIRKIWERSDKNDYTLKNVPIFTLDFSSINFYKHVIDIPIFPIENENDIITSSRSIHTITLKNFPEWALNMLEVTCLYTMDEAFTEFPFVTLDDPFVSPGSFGTGQILLKEKRIGQLLISRQRFHYWFNRIDNKDFYLKIFRESQVKQFLASGSSQGSIVPIHTKISLRIFNKRIYEKRNGKKE